MSEFKPYQPTPTEQRMINCLVDTINAIQSGTVDAVGLCSTSKSGAPSFVYYNEPDEPVLRPAMSRLLGLYEMKNRRHSSEINAPVNNRSYGTH